MTGLAARARELGLLRLALLALALLLEIGRAHV